MAERYQRPAGHEAEPGRRLLLGNTRTVHRALSTEPQEADVVVWDAALVDIDARPEPPRARRTSDLVRLVLSLSAMAVFALLGSLGSETTAGLQEDITTAVRTVPSWAVSLFAALNSLIVVALPLYLVLDLAIRRRWRQLLSALLAAAISLIASGLVNRYVVELVDGALGDAMALPVGSGGARTPLAFALFVVVSAFMTVQGNGARPRTVGIVWVALLALSIVLLIDLRATPLALALSLLGGHVIGLVVRYAVGTENPRVPAIEVALALARVGVRPTWMRQRAEESEVGRRFDLGTTEGDHAMAQVFDPDRRTAQLLSQLTRLVRVRTWVTRSPSLNERGQVQQAVVPALMARSVGVRTPAVLAAVEVDERTMVVAEERRPRLRSLVDISPEAISDEALAQAWREVRRMHHAGVAHERLHPGSFAVDDDGQVWVLGLAQGEIAAPRLRMRLDRAELLIATAALVGADRALTAAERAIGAEDLANLPALMQPVALNPETRRALKEHPGLLEALREEAIARAPEPSADQVRLERLRPRSVISLVAATFAVYVLAGQLGDVDPSTILSSLDWWWAGAAVAASLVTYLGSAWTISPFSPVAISQGRWLMAQFAATFVTLVAPAAVGSAGTNVRVIQQAGAPPGLALASVGVSTAVTFITTVLALVVVTVFGAEDPNWNIELPSSGVLIGIGVVVGLIVLAFVVPMSRRVILARLRPSWENAVPRLLDVLRNPRRLFAGAGGSLLTSLAYAATLYCSVRAYGVEIPIGAAVVVYLGAGILGSVAPTPGGIGAVEAALIAGLSAVGVPADAALPAALLYRTVTFWLPTVPGYLAFQWLQRRDAI